MQLLPANTPLIFTDGTAFFKRLAKNYIQHKQGFFILAPSGVGKTHYINSQKKNDWIDGDVLWTWGNAHPDGPWWLMETEDTNLIDQNSDAITAHAKKNGFWVMGASNFWLKPDAIVLPHWSTHKKYIRYRETHNYDGGATSDRLDSLLGQRRRFRRYVKKGVPQFTSVADAVEYLVSTLKHKNK